MMRTARYLTLVVVAFCIGLLGATGIVVAAEEQPLIFDDPEGPEVVGEQDEQLPDGTFVTVVGADGELVRCTDGELLKVQIGEGPPTTAPPVITRAADAATQARLDIEPGSDAAEVVDGIVPRCGPDGGGKKAGVVWIPESVAKDSGDQAPSKYVEEQLNP